MIRVADYIIDFIANVGVSHIFMVAGGGAMHLNDAIARNKKIKYICHHHEQAAAIAAEVYSRITENFGVALVTTGPGGTNTITGLLGAWQDSVPCMFISGQDKRRETIFNAKIPGLRQFGPQEANIVPIVQSITKYAVMVNEPEKIRYYLEKAYYIAKSGRPGPVWLDVPLDVQGSLVDPKNLIGFNPQEEAVKLVNKIPVFKWQELMKFLHSSRKPLIIAGNGIRLAGAKDLFLTLVKRLKIPVVLSSMAIDLMDYNDPYYIGVGGMKGQRAANIALQNADLLITIGSRLSVQFIGFEYEKFAPSAKKIVVDIDLNEHQKKTINIDLLIESDAKQFINEFLKNNNKSFSFKKDWVSKLKSLFYKYPVCLPEYTKLKGPINMYFAINEISEHLNNHDIIIGDAGFPYYMVGQATKVKNGQRLILPGSTAPLGYNLPSSIGASIAAKKNRVICITGDGSLQTNIHELGTIAINKLPIKIFVLNNGGYLSIRLTQANYFDKRFIGESKETGLGFPDMSKIAEAYGIKYFNAKNNKELKKIVPQVLKYNGPVLCNITCQEWQTVIPSVSSKQLPNGAMVSTTIDDMFPFLPELEMEKIREELK